MMDASSPLLPVTSLPIRTALALRRALIPLTVLVLGALVLVATRVELAPEVSPDFFFASDDPALASTQRIEQSFPTAEQLYLAARVADPLAAETIERIEALSASLAKTDGVSSVLSLTRGPGRPQTVPDSPLWGRLLLAKEDPHLTNLVVTLRPEDDADARRDTLEALERTVAAASVPSFALEMSGVPYVVELVRRSLVRDLRTFSLAAVVVFGLLVAAVYRSVWVVAGTLVACMAAALLTLAGSHLLGTAIGVLTANIVTIVFVLTLSHIVFLTANAARMMRERPEQTRADPITKAVARTLGASFWAMVTTLLGFLSLRLASAQPLRELSVAGAVATLAAMVAAYGLYPPFLAASRRASRGGVPAPDGETATSSRATHPAWWPAIVVIALAGLAAFGVGRLDTDPSLLAFFAEDGAIHRGIARIDATGGSSPLLLIVRDDASPGASEIDPSTAGTSLLNDASVAKLGALQERLEADPATGVVLSLSLLFDEARRVPLAAFLGREQLVDLLSGPQFDGIANSFLAPDRTRALYLLRMRETGRDTSRQAIITRLRAAVADEGLTLDTVGGIYQLQAALGALVKDSLVRGLGGLLLLFLLIAVVVAGEARTAAAMVGALVLVPLLLLGSMGFFGWPVDFISSPAANVALALGIDGMIHLVSAVRRGRRDGLPSSLAWSEALATMRRPILGAMAILAGGFGIFALSSFPPTQRFGLAVTLGTLAAAACALLVLPRLAVGTSQDPSDA